MIVHPYWIIVALVIASLAIAVFCLRRQQLPTGPTVGSLMVGLWSYAEMLFQPNRTADLAWPARLFLWLLVAIFYTAAVLFVIAYGLALLAWLRIQQRRESRKGSAPR